MSRRRILYVQQPTGGGSAASLHDMIAALDKDRFEPVVLCYQRGDADVRYREAGAVVRVLDLAEKQVVRPLPTSVRTAIDGLRKRHGVRTVNRLLRRDLPLARRIAAVMRQQRPDLVHHNDNPRGDRASILAARWLGLPQVSHVRFMPRYFRPVDRTLTGFVDRFVFVSEAVQRHFADALGRDPDSGRVIYNPFDLTRFESVSEAAASRVRAELGLGSQVSVVSSVARLVEWKGQDVFLRAVAHVARCRPNLRALVVGDAGDGPGARAFADGLHRSADDLGIADRVIFTGYRADVPELMAASDVIVHSSTRPEPFGRVIVEAMAAGRPVVATSAGGVPEIVEDERSGVLVPPGDAAGMAAAIDRLLADPARRRAIGERGRESVRSRFTRERFGAQIHALYETVLTGRLGGGSAAQ